MSKYKRILMAVTKGGMSQSEVAASLHVSKRDVSAAARVARELYMSTEICATFRLESVPPVS